MIIFPALAGGFSERSDDYPAGGQKNLCGDRVAGHI
jgi:hypothetical protein